MANYSTLISQITTAISTNGQNLITGASLQAVLLQMVSELGQAGYIFGGVVNPGDSPASSDSNLFYVAATAGTYTNFNDATVNGGELAIFTYSGGSWGKNSVTSAATPVVNDLTTGGATSALSAEMGKQIGDSISQLGQKVDGVALVDYTVTKGQQYTRDGYTTWNRYSCSEKIGAGVFNFNCPTGFYYSVYKYVSDSQGIAVFSYTSDSHINVPIDSDWIMSVKKVNGTELSTADIDTINNAGIVTEVTGDSINTMRYKINDLEERIDPIEDFVNDNKIGNFLCLGDSLTFGVGVINSQTPTESPNTYPKQMEKILGGKSYNGGVGGSSMTNNGSADFPMVVDALTSGDYSELNMMLDSLTGVNTLAKTRWLEIESLNITDLDFIAIAFGTNDWTIGAGINAVCDALQTGINKLRQAFPGVKLYVFTPTFAYKLGYGLAFDTDNYTRGGLYLDEYCDAIEQKCNELNVPVKNMYYCSNIKSNNALSYYVDGKHRNANGYKLLAKQYAGFIRNN